MGFKRIREDGEMEPLDVVKCLMLLSKVGNNNNNNNNSQNDVVVAKKQSSSPGRVFVCKTCNRQFNSFQALGGHRASHKKPKLMTGDHVNDQLPSSPVKPKTHECSICGLEFAIGQALGGHMRRHRHATEDGGVTDRHHDQQPSLPVLKKSSSSKRVMCLDLDLDLNLAPPGGNDDLKLRLVTPTVDSFVYKSLKI
ncbi:zinc finger protein ZAT12 [Ziziphus jujuba]|uniref:Zinc finger protein ZAT12 n=1 Tax=Ziziphus jujuba TaxID=326968 RepID=A0A6P3Z9B2_ZIZJJ|nr:zinc finger protein ZAT12 [Ziziphus jujuba]